MCTFVGEGTQLASLLGEVIKQVIEPAYARGLPNVIAAERKIPTNDTEMSGVLSDREIEVLRLLAEGMSNITIADRLSIGLATIKMHVHHIIEKLEVKDRSQAVYRARELDLL